MSDVQHVIPKRQADAFQQALCERLGLDPAVVVGFNVSSEGNVTINAWLPPDEIEEMFNSAGR